MKTGLLKKPLGTSKTGDGKRFYLYTKEGSPPQGLSEARQDKEVSAMVIG
jgi:hypothetical protein